MAKLGYWDEALAKYEQRLEANPKDAMAITGKLKCLEALGRWEEAVKICHDKLDVLRIDSLRTGDNIIHTKAAVIGARAAWSLSEWGVMNSFVSQLAPDNTDGSFMRTVLAVHQVSFNFHSDWVSFSKIISFGLILIVY